uniref:Cytochrome P450 CYP71AT86 n=1 Tax=Plectranthus barbatus TaxID=41228 RepID=A0A1B0VRP8_9LAMI|nr:cytochrome P450 CYP71AT86 [Plectranthus barbatus]
MIIYFLIILPLILLYLLQKTRKPSKSLLPPGPPQLPLIGNLHQLATAGNLHVHLWQLSKKYGPIFHMKLGSLPLLVISSPKLAKEVMKTQDLAFCSRPKLLVPQRLSYNCLDVVFSPYSDHWREVRKITTTHLFSPTKIQSFHHLRQDEISRVVAKISSFASAREVFNFSELARAVSSNLICRIAFGKRYDEDGEEMRRFYALLHEVQTLMATFFVSDYFPGLKWVDKVAGLVSRLDSTCEKLDCFYRELIDEHLDRNRKEVAVEEDVLDVLLRLKEEKSCSIELTWDHIKALLMNIFIAATESTAVSMVWVMTALMKEPQIMHKVQSEIRSSTGRKGKVEEDDLPKLHYLKAVIYETMRLYPPAPLLVPRESMERCSLDGFEVPPKTVVYINAWAIARDPEYWENPDEFVPERFLNSNLDVKGQDFEIIPFGSGRRICPGISMGLVDLSLIIGNLLKSFDWELPPGMLAEDVDTDSSPGIGVHKKIPLLLLAKKYVG